MNSDDTALPRRNSTYLDKLREDIIFTEQVRGQTLTFHTTW